MRKHSDKNYERFWFFQADVEMPLVEDFGYGDWHRAIGLPWHSHAGFEIVLVLDGGIAYEMDDGSRIALSGGEFFFNLPGRRHRGVHSINSPCKLFWIVFDPSVPDACDHTVFQPSDLAHLAACCREKALQVLPYTPAAAFLLDRLQEAITHASGLHHAACLRSLLCQVLLETTGASAPVLKQAPTAIQAAQARMEQEFAGEMNMGRVAADLGISAAHFYSLFHAATGQTPNDYLLRLRIRNAQALLAESSRSVTEIAFATGFNSSQHFCKAFRKYTGQTPSGYRQTR